ncbi:MAG: efflux RND transporter permease subunit [Chloroflexi bacterium]|nr:efflux RND transporter permease subunit [Chloroflexota bacterium]
MSFLTGLALRRRSVTMLVIVLVLVAGVVTYRSLQRELFPDIEFPNITIVTIFPNANPETIEREITEPIEEAIDGIQGLKQIQSTSSENTSVVLLTFEFGEDMDEAERTVESNINGINFPDNVDSPLVSRINNNTFPVLQLSILGDRDIPSLQRIVDDVIVPKIDRIDGVAEVTVLGELDERVNVIVDTDKLADLGLTMLQVSTAIRENNTSFPGGDIDQGGKNFPIRATHEFGSLDDIRNLTIGFEGIPAFGVVPVAGRRGDRPVLLKDVAEVELGTAQATSISRTNGKPSLGVVVLKDPDANTVDVTEQALAALDRLVGLPPDVEILILQNDGPEVEEQLSGLLREGMLGFFFALSAVFIFLINTRPTLLRGLAITLRPTAIIGVSIPLSIMAGILVMGAADLSLNFMSLSGLAIAVGRVVDDSIVVLENMYRHMQRGEDRFQAALVGTREVGAAIVSSTLSTVVVFIPLAFIPGLVGEFFTPFAMSVSFALLASTLVALTAVPVLGVLLMREGDFPAQSALGDDIRDTYLQRIYTPVLVWSLGHKILTLAGALGVVAASLALLLVIPVTFFPAGAPQFLTIDIELPVGSSISRTFTEVAKVEAVLERFRQAGHIEVYQGTLGSASDQFGQAVGGGAFHQTGYFAKLPEGVPLDIADQIRAAMPVSDDVSILVAEISGGPPSDALEITVVGSNFTAISATAKELVEKLSAIDGVINISSDVSEARDELTINVDPHAAAEYGLTTAAVGRQINQFIVGAKVSEVDLQDLTLDIVVMGQPEDADDIEELKNLEIEGPLGRVKLGSISDISIEQGPVSISRFDLERSATISGEITAEDTRAVGVAVERVIASLDLPAGVGVETGGIFEQINEGFQDVFTAMLIGVILVYLVMVASLGSLRDPLIVVLSLPLAIVGALVALAVTDKTLSLSALMGLLLLIGVVVTNAIVLITFVEQLRQSGLGVYDALIEGGRTRVRPILMTAFTTTFALFPLAVSSGREGDIIGAELATVVIGGLVSSTFLTLVAVPVIYTIMHVGIPNLIESISSGLTNLLSGRQRSTEG